MKTTFHTAIAAIACNLATQSEAMDLDAPEPSTDKSIDIPLSDYTFSKKRCPAKWLDKKKKNLCDDCSATEIDGTCGISFLKGDLQMYFGKQKACRCNPDEFVFKKKELRAKKCNDGLGCPDNDDGLGEGTCHKSHPWYDPLKFRSEASVPRCQYVSQPVENFPVVEPNDDLSDTFTQQINVFGIPVVGRPNVPVDKLTHVAKIMAEYLDNDEDGDVDDPAVADAMKSKDALLMVFAD